MLILLRSRNRRSTLAFKVRWAGFGDEHDSWEPYKGLMHVGKLHDYLRANHMKALIPKEHRQYGESFQDFTSAFSPHRIIGFFTRMFSAVKSHISLYLYLALPACSFSLPESRPFRNHPVVRGLRQSPRKRGHCHPARTVRTVRTPQGICMYYTYPPLGGRFSPPGVSRLVLPFRLPIVDMFNIDVYPSRCFVLQLRCIT